MTFMKSSRIFILAVFPLCFSLGLSACGNKNEDHSGDAFRLEPKNGELSKSLDEIQKDSWAEDCDRQLSAKAIELVTLFDRRADEIAAFAKDLPPSTRFRNVSFAGSSLKEYIDPPTPQAKWDSYNESWEQTYSDYLEIKNQPLNRNWMIVNANVRSLIMNDQWRVVDGSNLELQRDSATSLEALLQKLTLCNEDHACTFPTFSDENLSFIQNNKIYRNIFDEMKRASDSDAFRESLALFKKRVSNDLKRYAFRVNPSIISTRGTEANDSVLTIPFDGSDFSDHDRAQLQSYIEPIWKTEGLKVLIEWRNSWTDSIYKIFFNPALVGTRPWVSSNDREMHLFPQNRTRSVAHETGHVLGFRDHYYTVWNRKTCTYIIEYNDTDIMGDSDAGSVTPDEWAELKKQYFK